MNTPGMLAAQPQAQSLSQAQTTPAADPKAGMLSDWYKSYLEKPPQAATYNAASAGASTWNPDANSTVQGQLTKVLDAGGPLAQRAETKAQQGMLKRGLGNSSIAIGAGQSALYEAAMPIASQDASTFADAGKTNATLGTQVSIANANSLNEAGRFNAGAKNDMSGLLFKTAADFGLEDKRQTFQAGESATDRAWRTGERVGSEGFTSRENAADRTFRTGERVAGQEYGTAERLSTQGFQAGENNAQRTFQAGENALQRSFSTGERVSQNDFVAVQATLDRAQQLRVQQLQEGGMDKRQAETIAAQERSQKSDQVFTDDQKNKDRLFTSAERAAMQQFETGRQKIQNDLTERMQVLQEGGMDRRQAAQLAQQEALTKLGEAGVQNRFDAEQALRSSQFNIEQVATDRRMAQQHANELERLGVANKLSLDNVPANLAAQTSFNTLQAVNSILADPNLTPDAKKGAIQNAVDYANTNLTWLGTFYKTAFPPMGVPGQEMTTPGQVMTNPMPPSASSTPATPSTPLTPDQAVVYGPNQGENRGGWRGYSEDTGGGGN